MSDEMKDKQKEEGEGQEVEETACLETAGC
jgi:hypothetical protein